MKKLTVLILLSVLFSCKKEEPVNSPAVRKSENKTETPAKSSANLQLETFAFPQEIDGCSCYFAADREEFVKQNYIYVDDYGRNAFIKINGQQVKLQYDKKNEVLPEKSLNIRAHNDDFKIQLKGKVVEEGEIETALYKGILTVERADGKKTELPVYGECGC